MEADQDIWASASSHASCWSRDDDSLSFESLSVTSLQSVEPAHSIITDGLQSIQQYNHPTVIRDVTVNHFNNCLYLLDDSGIVRWSHGNHRASRVFQFPPYKHKLLSTIIYSDYYNVFFVLTTAGKVKVLNKDFSEVHTLELPIEQSKVSCIAFNDRTNQLVTGGLGGIKVFNYCQQQVNWKVIQPMAQYSLLIDHMSEYAEGVWIRRVSVSSTMDWLIGMSACDVLIYTFNATLLLHLKRLHQGHVTACVFIPMVKYYVSASEDASIKVWSESGSLITSFNSHLKEVTAMLVHPHCQWVIITCSLDGTIKQWNLITLQMEYSLTSNIGGGMLMSVIDKNCFYIMSGSSLELVEFNFVTEFWALSYCRMSQLSLVLREQKPPQILARGVDGSVRLYSSDCSHATTVLPPHHSSSVLSVAYCNDTKILCTLISNNELWVYSTRFNPARRVAVTSGDKYFIIDTLLSSVLPTAIRFHHKVDITTMCACGSLIVLGMMDGRVIILDSRIDDELKAVGYLQAYISPVMLLKHDKVLDILMCVSNHGDTTYVQLWDVISWSLTTTVQCDDSSVLVDCAMLEKCLMTGHDSGTVSVFTLSDTSSLNNHNESEEMDDGESGVTSVQSSHSYSLFATSHCSNAVRLWNSHFILLLEVSMATSLYGCCFLPAQATLILSLHNHLYKLLLNTVLPPTSLILHKETEETIAITDSDSVIINDLTSSPDPLQQHLAGATAITTSQTAVEQEQTDENSISDDESILSAAATETYQSPSITPVPPIWLFPTLGPLSPTTSSGDLSCEDSAASLLVPAEEAQGEYQSPNKATMDSCVVTSSAGNTTHPTDVTLCSASGNDRSVATEGQQESAKVTKVTGIKQKLVIVDNKRKSRNNKKTKKKPNPEDATKKKISLAEINVSSDASIVKPVAMERDKSSGEVVTLTPTKVSKDFNQEHQILKSDKLESPNKPLDGVLNPSARTVKKLSTTIIRTNRPPAKADRSSKTDQNFNKPLSKTDKQSSKFDQQLLKTDQSSKVDQQSSKSVQHSSKIDQQSSKQQSSKIYRPSSKTDQKANKVANQALLKIDKAIPQDVTMTTDKSMIGVVISKTSHDAKTDVTSRKTRSADSTVNTSTSSTAMGWQMDAIERATWRHCLQTKRHEEAQLRRLQKDCERRLVKSASHSKCFPTTNSIWQHNTERPRSSAHTTHSSDSLSSGDPHSSYHEHKLNCTDYRLQLYEHEK